jgi:hypothetical protein
MTASLVLLSLLCCLDGSSLEDTASAGSLQPLGSPCGSAPVTAVLALEHGRAWVGCGADGGVFRTLDAGGRFEAMHASGRLAVNALASDGLQRVLLCGRDFDAEPRDPLLLRWSSDEGWRALATATSGAPQACARVEGGSPRSHALLGSSGQRLSLESEPAEVWVDAATWWASPEGAPFLYDLALDDGCAVAVGATVTDPPVFLRPVDGEACLPLEAVTVDPDLVGELWALASPDGGQSWVAAGRSLEREPHSRAVLHRSPDGGDSWRGVRLPPDLAWVRDVAFSSSGACGVAVGERAGPAGGGFVLVSPDQGWTWRELEGDLPSLRVVSVMDDGFLVGGEQGFVGMGWCP